MKLAYIASLLLCLFTTVASLEDCTVALGVLASDECNADILDVIELYGFIAGEQQCNATTTTRRELRGTTANNENVDRELQCDIWQSECVDYGNGYYCILHNTYCGRDLKGKAENVDNRRLVDPLLDAGWFNCTFPVDEFVSEVADFLEYYEHRDDILQCWESLWCRTNQGP